MISVDADADADVDVFYNAGRAVALRQYVFT